MTLLAHAGHWTVQLLYVAPVAVVAGALYVQGLRERRRAAADASLEEPP